MSVSDTPQQPSEPQEAAHAALREALKKIRTARHNYPLSALVDSEDLDAIVAACDRYSSERANEAENKILDEKMNAIELPASSVVGGGMATLSSRSENPNHSVIKSITEESL